MASSWVLVVVGASNNTPGVTPFLFYFLAASQKHINRINPKLRAYLVAALPRCGLNSFPARPSGGPGATDLHFFSHADPPFC
jgi:hypothetical protein